MNRLTREVLSAEHWRQVAAWVESKFAKNPRLAFTVTILQERLASYKQRKFLFGGIYRYIGDCFRRDGILTDKGLPPTPEMIHCWSKKRYLDGSDGVTAYGTTVSVVGSTKRMTRGEMQDYWMAIQQDFATRNYDIPNPREEQLDLLFKE